MDHSSATRWPRRRFLVSGISLTGFVSAVGAVSLISGCGDDKSQMVQVENAPNPAEVAKDSMDFYKATKGASAKKKK
jgi:hypothetical protein